MSDDWFAEKTIPYGSADAGCLPEEAQALKDYCRKKTSAKEAAQIITQPIQNSDDPADNLHRLWGLLTDALMELPAAQIPDLVLLLDAIHQLPEPDLSGKQTKKFFEDGHLWRNLPRFGHMWSDEHKWQHCRDILAASEPSDRAELRAKHIRKAEAEAHIAVADIGGVPIDWGYECIADALEYRGAVLDFEIPAAAKWLAIAGERLYAGAVDGEESWALKRQRDFGKEAEAMSLERWSFWRERMEELLQQSQAAGEAAQAAVRDMKALDPGSHGSK